MHDGQLEHRLRETLRAEGDVLPLTITAAELDRRLTLRRRERLSRRGGLLAAAVAVIAVVSLVATTGGWFRAPGVGSGPSPEPTGGPMPSEAAFPCETIDPALLKEPPDLTFGVTPGDAIGYRGVQGAYRLGNREVGDPQTWSIPGPGADRDPIAAGPPTERLQVLASDPNACLTGLVAEAMQIAPAPGARINEGAITLDAIEAEPSRAIEFALPPSGQWIVRVRVDFDTEGRGEAWSQEWIGVLVNGPSANPSNMPAVLPELPDPAGTILYDEASPIDSPSEPRGVADIIGSAPVPPRGNYQVDVVCLGSGPIRWSLGVVPQSVGVTASDYFLAASEQTCDGVPASHSLELGIPPRGLPVIVRADRGTAWRIIVSSIGGEPAFLPPPLRAWVTAETGSEPPNAAAVFGHCVSSAVGADQCGPNWDTAALANRIRVTSGPKSTLSFQLDDDWDIAQARVTAVAAGTTAPEYSVAFIDESSREVRVPIQLDPGQWTVQVSLNAQRDDESFGAFYNFPLTIGAAEAAAMPTIETTDPVGSLLNTAVGDCMEQVNVFTAASIWIAQTRRSTPTREPSAGSLNHRGSFTGTKRSRLLPSAG